MKDDGDEFSLSAQFDNAVESAKKIYKSDKFQFIYEEDMELLLAIAFERGRQNVLSRVPSEDEIDQQSYEALPFHRDQTNDTDEQSLHRDGVEVGVKIGCKWLLSKLSATTPPPKQVVWVPGKKVNANWGVSDEDYGYNEALDDVRALNKDAEVRERE